MKNKKGFGLVLGILGFILLEIPFRFFVRLLSISLFAVEALMVFVPCLLIESVFMTRNTPFHWMVDLIDRLSDSLDEISDIDFGFL